MNILSAVAASIPRRRLPGVLVLLVLIATAAVAQSVPELPKVDGAGETPEIVVRLAPSTPGAAATGQLKLSSLTGRVVLLDVFSSKCPHCVDHAPHVAEFYKLYRQKGFTVLGLATDQPDSAADVTSFVAKAGITYPVGFLTAEIMVYFLDRRNHGVPQMVLFGRDGKMAQRLIGWSEATAAELRSAIEAELAKPLPPTGK